MFAIRAHSFSNFGRVNTVSLSLLRNFASKMGLPRVFFDMAADGQPLGRIVIEVSYFCFFFWITARFLQLPEIEKKMCSCEKKNG